MKIIWTLTAIALMVASVRALADEETSSIIVSAAAVDSLPAEYISITVLVYSLDDMYADKNHAGILPKAKDIVDNLALLDFGLKNFDYGVIKDVSVPSAMKRKPILVPFSQEITFEVQEVSQLEQTIDAIQKFEHASISDIQPMLSNPEIYYVALVDIAIKNARQMADALGEELKFSVDRVLNVEKSVELAASPKSLIDVDGISVGKPQNVLNQNLQFVEIRANVEVTFSFSPNY